MEKYVIKLCNRCGHIRIHIYYFAGSLMPSAVDCVFREVFTLACLHFKAYKDYG